MKSSMALTLRVAWSPRTANRGHPSRPPDGPRFAGASPPRKSSETTHGEDPLSAFTLNFVVSALVISFASWLSRPFAGVAGFIVALPLATMLVLPLSYCEHGSAEVSIFLAKSIFVASPISLAFFVPFAFSSRLGLTFWQAYGLDCASLPIEFFVHRVIPAF
jgi:hypothetical protein